MKRNFFKSTQNRYIYITTMLIVLLIVFQIINNLFQFLMINKSNDVSVMEYISYEKLHLELTNVNKENLSDNEISYKNFIIGNSEENVYKIVTSQLDNLKEAYSSKENITSEILNYAGEIHNIFICKTDITDEEISILEELMSKGINVIFTKIPSTEMLSKESVQNLLGIKNYNGTVKYKGIRFISDFFISDMLEYDDISVKFEEVELLQGTKTYSYSLMESLNDKNNDKITEDIKNEELPPLIWRYIHLYDENTSQVFVINASFMNSVIGYGIITNVMSQLYDDYLYPVVNSYCYLVKDLPYFDNFDSKELQTLYSRDAIGLQQDIIFPAITSFKNKYDTRITYYSPDYSSINSEKTSDYKYYKKQILSQTSELAFYSKKTDELITLSSPSKALEWKIGFSFLYEDENIQVPIIENAADYNDIITLETYSAISSMGYMSVLSDITKILHPEESGLNWNDVEKYIDTILHTHYQEFSYLDRLTVSDAVKRICIYELCQPEIEYTDKKVIMKIDNFVGEAYFIFHTDNEIKNIENGEFTKIGNKNYLIKATGNNVKIIYKN